MTSSVPVVSRLVPGLEPGGSRMCDSENHEHGRIRMGERRGQADAPSAWPGVRIGAGWIGLETTAAARAAGVEVTVLEMAELPLLRVLGREVAQVFADLHRDHGVDLRFWTQVAEITGSAGAADGVTVCCWAAAAWSGRAGSGGYETAAPS